MATWQRENQTDKAIKVILFLISPFFSFLYSLKRMNTRSSYVVFFLFAVFFGMAFSVPDNRFGDFKGDGVVYRLKFEDAVDYDTYQIKDIYKDYSEFDDGAKDIYVTTVSFIVSRFTDNYHWVFTFYAFVFALFMLKSLKILITEDGFSKSLYNYLLVLIFIMSNFIFNINGVRFWTAAWIGVYCMFQIYLNKNRKYFFLAAITPLVHVSFFVYVFVLVLAYAFKKYDKFWLSFFIISIFISGLSVGLMSSLESYFPPFIAKTIGLYTSDESIQRRAEGTLPIVKVFNVLRQLTLNITVILLYKNRQKIINNDKLLNLFQFLLVWMSFVNFGMAIPSLGGRFIQLSIPLIVYLWFMVLEEKRYYNWLIAFLFSFSLSYFFIIKSTLSVTAYSFYILNPFSIIYNYLL